MKALAVVAVMIVAVSFSLPGCGGVNHEEVALQVAQEWADESITAIASDIVDGLIGEFPVLGALATSVIEEQIREHVSWSYSTPIRTAEGRYQITAAANAAVEMSIPVLGDKAFDVSLDFHLDVDTEKAAVVDSRFDPSSLAVQER